MGRTVGIFRWYIVAPMLLLLISVSPIMLLHPYLLGSSPKYKNLIMHLVPISFAGLILALAWGVFVAPWFAASDEFIFCRGTPRIFFEKLYAGVFTFFLFGFLIFAVFFAVTVFNRGDIPMWATFPAALIWLSNLAWILPWQRGIQRRVRATARSVAICYECGCDLRGNPAGPCPECGAAVMQADASSPRIRA